MPRVANCTTKEYFRYTDEFDRMEKLKQILVSKNIHQIIGVELIK